MELESLESGSPRITSKKFQGSPKRLLLAVTCVCFGPLSFGFAVGFSSPAIPLLESDGMLDGKERTAWFGSLLTVGGMIGGPLAGVLIERFGRKSTLLVSATFYIIGFASIAGAVTTLHLYIGRFLCGLATGQVAVSAAVYIAEVSTKSLRGFLGACNQLSITVGILLSYTLGIKGSWKKLAIDGLIMSSMSLVAILFVPETPRWLLLKNRRQDALKALATLRGPHEDVEDECRDIEEGLDNNESISWQELYKPEYLRPLLIVIAIMVFQQLSGINAVMFYTVSIFNSAGFKKSGEATAFIGAVQVVATVLSCFLMDRSGRRKLLVISGSIMFLSCVTFGWYYYYTAGSQSDMGLGWLAISSLVVYIVGFSLGWGPIPMLVMSEIVPARVKGICSGISIFVSWFSAFIITKEFSLMQMVLGPAGTFWFFGICCLCGVMFVNKYLPETKGKSLEDIELYFLGKSLG